MIHVFPPPPKLILELSPRSIELVAVTGFTKAISRNPDHVAVTVGLPRIVTWEPDPGVDWIKTWLDDVPFRLRAVDTVLPLLHVTLLGAATVNVPNVAVPLLNWTKPPLVLAPMLTVAYEPFPGPKVRDPVSVPVILIVDVPGTIVMPLLASTHAVCPEPVATTLIVALPSFKLPCVVPRVANED